MEAESAIRLRSVSKRYADAFVVRDVDLEIRRGETFVLIGASGSGKTTVLKMINRLVEPTEGDVHVFGTDTRSVDVAELRRGIGYVIQETGLFEHCTVARNVACVPELLGWPRSKIAARVEEVLELVSLPPSEFQDRYPDELSGGQRQRVGIARGIAADPEIVLLDEPFGALDPVTRESVQDEFLALSARLRKTFVLVTHDITEAVRLGDRIAVLREGRVHQCDTPRGIVHEPADEFVEALLGRHRYQLELMTLQLGDLPAPATPSSSGPESARAIELAPDASIWDAVDRMARAGVAHVHVTDGPHFSRRQLLELAADGSHD